MEPGNAAFGPVTVCVPVYNAAHLVAETLDSIARQSHGQMRVLVSVDLSDDDSAATCLGYAGDPRFRVVAQERRLGWVDNINYLVERVETDDYCVIPHDDVIEPDYLTALQSILESNLTAAIAFTDIVAFGELQGAVVQPSIEGALFDRIIDFLVDHFDAVAFRGLVRRSRAGDDRLLKRNFYSSYAADSLWMLQILRHGALVRLPLQAGAGYRKRYRIGSQHHRWLKWNRERRTEAWIAHCVQCARLALSLPFESEQKQLIVFAVMQRAIKRFKPMGWRPFMTDLTDAHRALIQGIVAAQIAGIGGYAQTGETIARIRALPQYADICVRLWGEPDAEPVGQADPRYRPGAGRPG